MGSGFAFECLARDDAARTGRIDTPHGSIETPTFMPVATRGAVRGLDVRDLEGIGSQILLANAYHLHERPGEAVIQNLGGLHGFTGWRGPWLTDSGGYQVTSLADRAVVDEQGVTFRSPLDGMARNLTPEKCIAVQEALGSDIAMVLDECRPLSDDLAAPRANMERTLRWAERCAKARQRSEQALFGIVQGGVSPELRRESARETADIGFDGYAHGGLGLGESREVRAALLTETHSALPEARPRYLMGIGRPQDLLDAVARGVDLFDCVVPTRNGRHGIVFTSRGVLNLRNAKFREDSAPIEADCDCPVCPRTSRAYLRHLFHAGESLGGRLASLHNLRFYLRLLERSREAIREQRFAQLVAEWEGNVRESESP